MTIMLVVAGAMVGAPVRYLVDRVVKARHDSLFPWGTLTVNVVGCLILGCLARVETALSASMYVLLGVGFCGALTTYSTFSYETFRLAETRALVYAVMNVSVSIIACLGAALLGYTVLQALTT